VSTAAERAPWWRRGWLTTAAGLALLAYLPALTAAPGRMPADSKLYLYLDPTRFINDAASTFDPRQFGGWVPHQHIAYLWPAAPWFALFDRLGVADWIAHRLWIGTLLLAAGLGVRWCARLLGLTALAAAVAAMIYQLSPYMLPYVSRTSVMLLPWAGLGWIVAFTVRATRRRTWGDPAAIALIVFTVGAVNATALMMIVPAPALWLVHAAWQRSVSWRQAAGVALRVGVLTVPVSLWWVAMLLIQGRFGAEILPYSESLADVSLTSTAPEVWRSLGYWLFYVRDPYAATTTESLRYLSSTWSILVSFLLPIMCLLGLVWVRWAHRRFAALLIAAGALLAVGVHPIHDRSPLMRLVAGNDEGGLALALRSSTRALPVMNLGMALLAGSFVAACAGVRLRRPAWPVDGLTACALIVIAILNLPSLWTGAFVDPALERDESPPAAWTDAAAELDAIGPQGRVLQLPGAEFGAFRWGYTVDQPLPGLTAKPLITRDLLPLGSAGAMDLLYALDDRIQDGVFEPSSLAPVSRWLGVDTVWVANDLAFDRFRTARPQPLSAQIADAPGVGAVRHVGAAVVNEPAVPMIDEQALADPDATAPASPVDLYPITPPGTIVRAADRSVVVSGSGDGLVDLAAAGLLEGDELVRYSASLAGDQLPSAIADASDVFVTDSNRDRARHWRSSQDTTGYTESDQPGLGLLRDVASDARLPVFADRDEPVDPATQTVARQVGPVTATATSYGEPFAYLPEHRPYMAIDGDPATAWTVGEHADPIGETMRLHFDRPVPSIGLVQAVAPGARRITAVTVAAVGVEPPQRVELTDESMASPGQGVSLPVGANDIDITIVAVGGGEPFTASAVAGVGFADIITGLAPTVEVVRVPSDALHAIGADTPLTVALTRLRVDPMDRWRADPEGRLIREFDLDTARTLATSVELRVDRRATDESLATLFGWPAWASSRLTGSVANAGVSAIDGDPETAWITAFGGAVGATLTIDATTAPIDRITIHQPTGSFSRITELVLRSGSEERTIALETDATGTATAGVDPPLPPGPLDLVVSKIEPATTVDRRYADTVELPAALSEIELPGLPEVTAVADSSASVACTGVLAIDGSAQQYSFELTGQQAIDGIAAIGKPCAPQSSLAAGTHRVESLDPGLPVDVDRVVMSDRPDEPSTVATAEPQAIVTEDGRLRKTIEIDHCVDGCWLVLGNGYSTAWKASGPDGSLGDPQLVDGGFNGWRIPPSNQPVQVVVEWTQQRKLDIALVLSLLGVAVAIVLLVLDVRRGAWLAVPLPIAPPRLSDAMEQVPRRAALWIAAAWTVMSALVIAPEWALAGIAGGIALVVLRRRRLVELTAWATLVAVAALVTIRERRNAPAPNGGWPEVFESWHRLGMFAIVTVLVAALFADDAQPDPDEIVMTKSDDGDGD
jgi:arabinofuranan 3-O-arabinosyltransferase